MDRKIGPHGPSDPFRSADRGSLLMIIVSRKWFIILKNVVLLWSCVFQILNSYFQILESESHKFLFIRQHKRLVAVGCSKMVQLNNKISVMRHLIYRFVFEIFFQFRNLKAQIISEMSPTRLFENFSCFDLVSFWSDQCF